MIDYFISQNGQWTIGHCVSNFLLKKIFIPYQYTHLKFHCNNYILILFKKEKKNAVFKGSLIFTNFWHIY